MGRVVLLCLILIGCGPKLETKPEQEIVTTIVWNQAFKMTVQAPTIIWIDQPKLDCESGTGFTSSYEVDEMDTVGCLAGLTDMDSWTSEVAWPSSTTFHETALCHELCHAYSYIATGDSDPDHLGPCFVPVTGYVDKVNALLKDAGL